MANAIRQAERRTLEALEGMPLAEAILGQRPAGVERTRSGAVRRLEDAVRAVRESATHPPEPRAAAVCAAWREAEARTWDLAMSAERVARSEARKLQGPFASEEELTQEGYIGLLQAARRFDPARGIRFGTYARWWARAQMTRAIEHTGRLVRLPGGAVEQMRNLRKAATLRAKQGLNCDAHALAQATNIDRGRADLLLSFTGLVYLDAMGGDGNPVDDRALCDEDAPAADELACRSQALVRISAAFGQVLSPREQYVLGHHFGLAGEDAQTMSHIGRCLRLSRERVRQIQIAALQRLRDVA